MADYKMLINDKLIFRLPVVNLTKFCDFVFLKFSKSNRFVRKTVVVLVACLTK